ncbi:MAG TPA: dicarboxylate--CoA ligase PimA [Holosporales bacterium]|nr:dicarboxylate--CoA ligase PimA [Holosporales bacterium]
MVTKKDKPASKPKATTAVKKAPPKKVPAKKTPAAKAAPKKKTPAKSVSSAKYPWLKKYPEGISWDAKIKESPLYDLLEASAAKFPDRYLLDFLGKKYTYGEISNLVDRTAKGLLAQGVKQGTRLGLFLPNCPVYVVFYYAAMKIGATVVNFSPLYASREVATQIEDSNTEVMVTLDLEALYPKVYKMFERTEMKKMIVCPLKDQLPFPKNILFPLLKSKEIARLHRQDKRLIFFNDLIDNDGQSKAAKITPRDDIALIQYTGGTTGLPKGALLTHANVTANASQADMWFLHDGKSKEKVLAALPLFHVFAMTAVMNLAIKMGSEIVMMFPRFNPEDAMKMIQKHKITFFPAVPTIYNLISNHPDVKKYDLSSVRACLSGGAALPVEVKREFEELTGCKVIEAYGLSETSPAATANPLDGLNKEASIGIPFPGTTVKIMSLEDPLKEMKQGEKGEICISGPQVMKGYWNRPAETGLSLVKGLFHTGDVGYMDKDGYTFLVDRIKDLIICSGYNVYPRVIEEAIYLHPAVEETTVIGVPDKKRGETPKAFVKLKAGQSLTAQELEMFLEEKISPIEMPKMIEFREELPKTIIGKLSKKELVAEEKAKQVAEKEAAKAKAKKKK